MTDLERARALAERLDDSVTKSGGVDCSAELLREAAAFLRSLTEQEGWRTIDSAPRDGTYILVCRPSPEFDEEYGLSAHVVSWWTGNNGNGGAWWIYNSQVQENRCYFEPTHWMPLPAAPSVGQEGETQTMGQSDTTAPKESEQ